MEYQRFVDGRKYKGLQTSAGGKNMARYEFHNGVFKRRGCKFRKDLAEWEHTFFDFEMNGHKLRRLHRFFEWRIVKSGVEERDRAQIQELIPVES